MKTKFSPDTRGNLVDRKDRKDQKRSSYESSTEFWSIGVIFGLLKKVSRPLQLLDSKEVGDFGLLGLSLHPLVIWQ
jgi:hypothetical protein